MPPEPTSVDLKHKELGNVRGQPWGRRLWRLWPVILAGEAIFLIPFVLPRLFRPTMLAGWGITNLDFGLAFSCYGVVALIAYALGGPLADRFQPRWLMCMALAATAFGGLVLLEAPNRALLC